MCLLEPSSPHTTGHSHLRPGTQKGRHRNYSVWSADRPRHRRRGESEDAECRLCHGQYNPYSHFGPVAPAGLDPRQAWKGQTRTRLSFDGSREASSRGRPTTLGGGGTPLESGFDLLALWIASTPSTA